MAFFIVAFLVVGFAVGLATKEEYKSSTYAIYFLISIAWAFAWGPFAILTFLELAGGDYLARKLKTPFIKKPLDDLQDEKIPTTSSKAQTTKPSKSPNITTKQNKLPKLTKESIAKNTKLKLNIVRNTSEITSSLPTMSGFPHIENAFTKMSYLSDVVIASLDLSNAILSLDLPNIELKDALNPNELLNEINRTFCELDKVIADLVTTPLDYLKDNLSNKEKAELKRIIKGKAIERLFP